MTEKPKSLDFRDMATGVGGMLLMAVAALVGVALVVWAWRTVF